MPKKKISETARKQKIKEINRKLDAGEVGQVATGKFPHQAEDYLLNTSYTDLEIMPEEWLKSTGINPQKNGTLRPFGKPLEKYDEAYVLRARDVYRAVERMYMVAQDSNNELVYFNVKTPDQPSPRKSYVRQHHSLLKEIRDAFKNAYDGLIEVRYLDL